MKPVLVVSPHLDDAVLSCGQFMAGRPGCVIVTVFAGAPDPGVVTAYDRKCGFATSAEAVESRRGEDHQAAAMLNATVEHLQFLDSQYRDSDPDPAAISVAIHQVAAITKPEFVIGPLGLVHPDHQIVGDAVRALRGPVYLYEELPYRITAPDAAAARLDHDRTRVERAFIGDGPLHRKLSAAWCYRSQMRLPEFDNPAMFTVPERFWSFHPAA